MMSNEVWADKFQAWLERRNKARKRTTLIDACNYLRRLEGRKRLVKP